MPTEEQFDKEKAKAEVQALDAAPNNDKPPPNPALNTLGALPGVPLTGAEKQKYEGEMAKLYKEMDDKVRASPNEQIRVVVLTKPSPRWLVDALLLQSDWDDHSKVASLSHYLRIRFTCKVLQSPKTSACVRCVLFSAFTWGHRLTSFLNILTYNDVIFKFRRYTF